ncbi:hypothetical protein Nepgr_007857 [Nepenthes gracilis]|uniref:Uncharacterized protein n=1 Tax=Nepenthes gracilis TaxID=150966 RepID=A0AAD3S8I6_NEPGR|nr:hypothetical protein Nepgr_007857 [Nepenthes gracilis]
MDADALCCTAKVVLNSSAPVMINLGCVMAIRWAGILLRAEAVGCVDHMVGVSGFWTELPWPGVLRMNSPTSPFVVAGVCYEPQA